MELKEGIGSSPEEDELVVIELEEELVKAREVDITCWSRPEEVADLKKMRVRRSSRRWQKYARS